MLAFFYLEIHYIFLLTFLLIFCTTPKLNANIFNKYVKQFAKDTFATDGTMLYCKICEVKVSAEKKFTVTQHIKTNKHERLLARQNKPAENKQQFISQPSNKKSVFSHDLYKAMLCANIPLHKISNVQFRSFLENYTLNYIPSVSTLRKTYINDCYLEAIDQIRKDVVGNKIWVFIDNFSALVINYLFSFFPCIKCCFNKITTFFPPT